MKIGDWVGCEDLNRVFLEVRELGLESNLAELEAFGFTVVEGALSPQTTKRARDAVIRSAEKRFGKSLDLENETEHHNVELAPFLFYSDPVFEEVVLNPRPLALITYLLGYSCNLSSMTSHVKGPGDQALPLHSDTANGAPSPFSPFSEVANVNYALTDYTEEGGCLAMVPGSHQFARQPLPWEIGLTGNARNPMAIPMEIPAGSAVVWHGNTWHGSFQRQIPGLRINLAVYYVRQNIEPQERYRDYVPEGLIERHGGADSRMAWLLGQNKFNGWGPEGPDMPRLRKMRAGRTWQS